MTSGANIEAALRQSQDEARERAELGRRNLRNDLVESVAKTLHNFDEFERSGGVADTREPKRDIAMVRLHTDALFNRKVYAMSAAVIDTLRANGVNV